jgi:hypothetical protein
LRPNESAPKSRSSDRSQQEAGERSCRGRFERTVLGLTPGLCHRLFDLAPDWGSDEQQGFVLPDLERRNRPRATSDILCTNDMQNRLLGRVQSETAFLFSPCILADRVLLSVRIRTWPPSVGAQPPSVTAQAGVRPFRFQPGNSTAAARPRRLHTCARRSSSPSQATPSYPSDLLNHGYAALPHPARPPLGSETVRLTLANPPPRIPCRLAPRSQGEFALSLGLGGSCRPEAHLS